MVLGETNIFWGGKRDRKFENHWFIGMINKCSMTNFLHGTLKPASEDPSVYRLSASKEGWR